MALAAKAAGAFSCRGACVGQRRVRRYHFRMQLRVQIRLAEPGDEPRLQAIRAAAFASIFVSFRSMLGDELYELAQAKDDANQSALLSSMFVAGSPWQLYTAVVEEIVGFVSIRVDSESQMGEIGLNAVDPAHAGKGIGTHMYSFAVDRLKAEGMRVATVSTGGDPSHAAARRAYQKAGFAVHIPSVWMCRKL
jgi:ribosomal protein S18 acetylase RimI-like enzyme